MKKILILITLLLLSCSKETTEHSDEYILPEGLKDCKVYTMVGGCLSAVINVVRCPSSETGTTYNMGKTTMHVVTVEVDTNGLGEYNRLKNKFGKK